MSLLHFNAFKYLRLNCYETSFQCSIIIWRYVRSGLPRIEKFQKLHRARRSSYWFTTGPFGMGLLHCIFFILQKTNPGAATLKSRCFFSSYVWDTPYCLSFLNMGWLADCIAIFLLLPDRPAVCPSISRSFKPTDWLPGPSFRSVCLSNCRAGCRSSILRLASCLTCRFTNRYSAVQLANYF